MVSVGEDQNLNLWDLDSNQILLVKFLGVTPSAIKFSNDGDILVIGFVNGSIMVLDSKIVKNVNGKFGESFLIE